MANYIIGGVISIILGVLIIPKILDFYTEKSKPLEIKPTNKKISVSENGDNWNEEFFIYLINHTKNPYYDINIISEFPKNIDISILPEKFDIASLGSKDNKILMGLDFMICGENKEKGTKCVQTVINNIDPNERKKIKVIVDKKGYRKNFNLEFKITNFNKIPKPILSK